MAVEVGDCPTGCGRKRLAGKMLCKVCWAEVPKDVQDRVWQRWRAYKGSSDVAESQAWVEYCQARSDAMAHVR